MHLKDNDNSPHGKFHRFLFPFSSKFPELNFAPYLLYVTHVLKPVRDTNSEPGLPVHQAESLFLLGSIAMYEKRVCTDRNSALFLFLFLPYRRAGLSVGISDKT